MKFFQSLPIKCKLSATKWHKMKRNEKEHWPHEHSIQNVDVLLCAPSKHSSRNGFQLDVLPTQSIRRFIVPFPMRRVNCLSFYRWSNFNSKSRVIWLLDIWLFLPTFCTCFVRFDSAQPYHHICQKLFHQALKFPTRFVLYWLKLANMRRRRQKRKRKIKAENTAEWKRQIY